MAAVGLHPLPSHATVVGRWSNSSSRRQGSGLVDRAPAAIVNAQPWGAGRCAQPCGRRSRMWTSKRSQRYQSGRCTASASVSDPTGRNEQLKDAAKGGDLALVESLLSVKDVQVNLPSEARAGWTALHLAAFYEHPEVVETLLKAGASTEIRNESGNTALQLACLRGNVGIAKLLLDYGADIRAESDDRGTVMDYAIEWGGDEMVEFLQSWAAAHNTV